MLQRFNIEDIVSKSPNDVVVCHEQRFVGRKNREKQIETERRTGRLGERERILIERERDILFST